MMKIQQSHSDYGEDARIHPGMLPTSSPYFQFTNLHVITGTIFM